MDKANVFDLAADEFECLFSSHYQEPAYRARQILEQLYRHRVVAWDEMRVLPVSLRTALAERYSLRLPDIKVKQVSGDGTRKYLWTLQDGVSVESVLIPEGSRRTACFSTQAGCPVGCSFCATGQGGFRRQLSAAEIVGQLLAIEAETGERITNAVAMGQGEPLLNTEAVFRAFSILHDRRCLGMSARHLTLSTVGIIPGIREFSERKFPYKLAVSLHSARQEVRDRLIPVSGQYPLVELKKALRAYADATRNRITFEYLLLGGINDGRSDLRALIDFAQELPVFINLIPWNPVSTLSFSASSEETARIFASRLSECGFEVAVRKEKGGDIQAACGQLTQHFLHD